MRAPLPTMALAVAVCGSLAGPAAADPERSGDSSEARLVDAYKREYAFLEAEKRSLDKRMKQHERRAEERIAQAEQEVAALQSQIVGMSSKAQRLEELVRAADRELQGLDKTEDVVGDILARAGSAYGGAGVQLPEIESDEREALLGQVQHVFDMAPGVLAELGRVRAERGEYFDASGRRVEGEILRVGDIAAYGLEPGAQGVLAPAGGDRLKIWSEAAGAETAAALAEGGSPEMIPIFLFESLDEGVDERDGQTPLEVIQAGGLVAWVIVGLGVVALVMVVVRGCLLGVATVGTRRLVKPVLDHLQRGDRRRAVEIATRARNPTGRVVAATLESLHFGREQLEDVVAEAVLDEQPRLSRFGSAILVIAAVAPLMGLLGTVTGMISTFDVITEFGTGNPKLLSGGISEALITTELGLVVAIPSLLLGHLLSGWSERIRDNLDASALAVVNRARRVVPPSEDEADEAADDSDMVTAAGRA